VGLLYLEALEVPVDVQIIETEHSSTSCLLECFEDSLHILFYAELRALVLRYPVQSHEIEEQVVEYQLHEVMVAHGKSFTSRWTNSATVSGSPS
jgi:hypothetical protein